MMGQTYQDAHRAALAERDPTRRSALNRLAELTLAEQQRTDRAAGDNALHPGGMPSSGIDNSSQQYTDMLNRQSEIADLGSRLGGKGPVNVRHSYGGTDWATGDETMATRPSLQALQAAPMSYDNLDRETRQAAIRTARAGADIAGAQAGSAIFARDPYRARTEAENAAIGPTVGRQAETALFNTTPEYRRRQEEADLQFEGIRRRYTDPAIVRAQTDIEKAKIAAGAQRDVAGQNAGARNRSSAISALATFAGMNPDQPEVQQQFGAILDNLQGQAGAGGGETPTATMDEVRRYAQARGISEAEAAKRYSDGGYVIQRF